MGSTLFLENVNELVRKEIEINTYIDRLCITSHRSVLSSQFKPVQ